MLSDWGELRKPDVISGRNIGWAVVVHLVFFGICWLLSIPLPDKEIAIPIDLTVVVNENLNGDPDEPPPEAPPVKQPDPPPPPPPQPKVETPPPPPPVEVRQDAVVKEPEKKIEKKPEKPKPTKEELKELKKKRIKEMQDRLKKEKVVKEKPKAEPRQPTRQDRLKAMQDALNDGTPPKYNGKTDKRPDNWQELLNQGYRPGAKTQLASSENQRCISLIKARFDTCWAQVGIPPWTDTLREMHLSLKFSPSGKILSYSLTQRSSDGRVDKTVLDAARLMNAVAGLSSAFLESNNGSVTIKVKVLPK